MAIEKGQAWGAPGEVPADAPVAASDAEAAGLVGEHEVISVRGGDLARTLGVNEAQGRSAHSSQRHIVPVDALRIVLDDGSEHVCIAHAIVGRPARDRTWAAIMNAAFVGERNLAPRAHPGDGLADVLVFDLALDQRFKAMRRMRTGTHVPHPGIAVRRKASGVVDLGRAAPIRIDGEPCGRSRSVRYEIVDAAIRVGL